MSFASFFWPFLDNNAVDNASYYINVDFALLYAKSFINFWSTISQISRALKNLRKAVKLDGDNVNYLHLLALLLSAQNKVRLIMKILFRSISIVCSSDRYLLFTIISEGFCLVWIFSMEKPLRSVKLLSWNSQKNLGEMWILAQPVCQYKWLFNQNLIIYELVLKQTLCYCQ